LDQREPLGKLFLTLAEWVCGVSLPSVNALEAVKRWLIISFVQAFTTKPNKKGSEQKEFATTLNTMPVTCSFASRRNRLHNSVFKSICCSHIKSVVYSRVKH
jgi:hypothetical protein